MLMTTDEPRASEGGQGSEEGREFWSDVERRGWKSVDHVGERTAERLGK